MSRSGLLPIVAFAATLASAPVAANDARLTSRVYNANEVVRIAGRAGVQATISFGENEHMENVAIGDSSSWQVTPNKRANILFLKPLQTRARTNLTVITDQHTYFFDLLASPTAQALYALRFSYPQDLKRAAQPQPQEKSQPAVFDRLADKAQLNFAWRSKGKSQLLPSRIYDDGRSLYLTWPRGARLPAILVRNDKGVEGPVNFAVHDDVIVLDGVPHEVVLRLGKDSAILENRAQAQAPALMSALSVPASRQSQGS